MKSKPLMLCLLAATILSSNLTTANEVLTLKSASTASTSQATVKTITQQIAKLEVERAELESRYLSSHPAIQAIDGKLQSLRQHLVQLQPNGNQTNVAIAVSEAIKARIAKLEVERAELEPRYIPSHPAIQTIDAKLRSLRQRLVQIRPKPKT